ncbi:MAG: pyruvate:ferredoxin (flavodoxin) oxidoreductase, partial [Clostridiales Family XIII bacterium]|nr:pyruvate:ferredoxin (flavodoxin) oxidoreductase [Clostridiales Family XIII bacterium]
NCKFWGLGADGTVGANKTAIKIIGDDTDLYAQGYFAYDSKKSGGVTISHLRFGKRPIKSAYLINRADYVACHNQAYLTQYDMLKDLKEGGVFLLNCLWSEEELSAKLPARVKRALARKKIKFYTLNGVRIAEEIGLGGRINMVMQAAFFKLTNVIPIDEAVKHLKDGIVKAYEKKGQKVLDMNFAAVDRGIESIREIAVPAGWADAADEDEARAVLPAFIEEVLIPMNRQEGDSLPVSAFAGREDGAFPSGTAAYEKRGVAVNVPQWKSSACIQCNQCSFVCPHAAIRPVLLDEAEKAAAPQGFATIAATGKGLEGFAYRMQLSPLDCLGCGNCADICPSKEKALTMVPLGEALTESANWDYSTAVTIKDGLMSKETVKGSQFAKPYVEFSGACAGCGETPYIKLITQLYGDRMIIGNATGCSSIWGASAPSMPYTKDANGRGPAWANSLFEDNAEYGYGMALATRHMRDKITDCLDVLLRMKISPDLKAAAEGWLADKDDGARSRAASDRLEAALVKEELADADARKAKGEILARKDYLVKKSIWTLGGDGWAYDIGYGGLDHVLASGENVNVLVFDTEVYSNTGGQASKSTPVAAIAKFAASGTRIKKKDLGMMAISYGYVYVAQVGMGADKNQFLKAVVEAESYDGPSLILCYAPCINHGLRKGMGKSQENIKEAVAAGYWQLFRHDPRKKQAGENPFTLDSKEPTGSFRDFILGQTRYAALAGEFPDVAEGLFAATEADARERLAGYKRLAGL